MQITFAQSAQKQYSSIFLSSLRFLDIFFIFIKYLSGMMNEKQTCGLRRQNDVNSKL